MREQPLKETKLWRVMSAIAEEPSTVAELADDLGYTRSTINEVVFTLRDFGFIVVTDMQDNRGARKSKRWALSDDGSCQYSRLESIAIAETVADGNRE